MQLTFLAAADGTRLSKRFTKSGDSIETDSYPQVREVNSVTFEVDNLHAMYEALVASAEEGLCLLKGNPNRPIVSESRAGLVDTVALTDWLVLDLDFEGEFTDIDAFLDAIGASGVSYIRQISASAGITKPAGLRSHVFLRLSQPTSPAMIKEWTRRLNLHVDALRKQMRLTASKRAVSWPLDVMVNDNTRLLYIAPPEVSGMDDPMHERITYHEREQETLDLNLTDVDAAANQAATQELITDLRNALGLPKTQSKTTSLADGTELLLNPARSIVTGVREARGWVYLNLNGGDSWAYYYDPKDPTYLRNFKGEPNVRLQDIASDYCHSIIKPPPQLDIHNEGTHRFVFRHNQTDTYYTAIWHPNRNQVETHKAQRKNLPDFLSNANQQMPDPIPIWDIEFNPTTTKIYDPEQQWINKFRPSRYMLERSGAPSMLPPTIDKVLTSVFVDQPTKLHFLNWLAFVFNTREKAKTGWIITGNEGTGKGLLHNNILSPLFNREHTMIATIDAIKDSFKSWVEDKIILSLDEFKVEPKDEHRVPELLRNLVTEPFAELRAMRSDRQEVRNYLNILIFSNLPDPMKIPVSDRRWNVAPRQNKRLEMTDAEIETIKAELDSFANYIRDYKFDAQLARTALQNEAKTQMRHSAEGTSERIIRALQEGDLQFFIDMIDHRQPAIPDPQSARYKTIVHEWVDKTPNVEVTLDDLRAVYQHLVDGKITKIRLQRHLSTLGFALDHNTSSTVVPFTKPATLPQSFLQETAQKLKAHK